MNRDYWKNVKRNLDELIREREGSNSTHTTEIINTEEHEGVLVKRKNSRE